jgi:biotin carboxyl carrier protein
MRYEVEVGGRLRHVVVTRAGGCFAVTVDGRTRNVDAARIDGQTLSLIVDSGGSEDTLRSVEVTIAPDPAGGPLTVGIGSMEVGATLNGRRRWGRKSEGSTALSGPQRLVAPMPGKVVRVLVKTGDAVSVRQPVVVVEAMKMENELRADRDGTVTDVHAREGLSVDAGALLLVIQ